MWFRLYGLDPESGTENHSLYLEWNYHSLIIEPNSRLFKLQEILDSKILLITRKWHEKEALSSFHQKTPPHQPLDWSPRARGGVSSGSGTSWKLKVCERILDLPVSASVSHYESITRDLKRRPVYECRCNERIKTKAEESTRLAYTEFLGEMEHLQIKMFIMNRESES